MRDLPIIVAFSRDHYHSNSQLRSCSKNFDSNRRSSSKIFKKFGPTLIRRLVAKNFNYGVELLKLLLKLSKAADED